MPLTQVPASLLANSGAELGTRNRIINGDMRIDQRNVGASATPSAVSSFVYTLDRWWYFATQASKFTIQRNAGGVTPPNGFTNYIGLTVASAVTPGAADQFIFGQSIEGFNFSDFAWGTAAASPVTISFWVRSSLTGQFSVALENLSGTRTYAATYTITAANTWQNVTVTIPGETSGTWSTNNALGTYVIFDLGVGANQQTTGNVWFSGGANAATGNVKLVQTSGATFYVTGVQLEAGSVATPFERRQIGQELTLCQRYFQKTYKIDVALGTTGANTGYVEWNWGGLVSYATVSMFLRTTMRTYPTFQSYNVATGAAGGFVYYNGSTSVNGTGTLNGFDLGTDVVTWYMDATGRTNLQFHYTMTAEL